MIVTKSGQRYSIFLNQWSLLDKPLWNNYVKRLWEDTDFKVITGTEPVSIGMCRPRGRSEYLYFSSTLAVDFIVPVQGTRHQFQR